MSDLISRSELLKAFNNKNVQITFDLPVEEVLGEDVDLDDFAMLVQDAIQAYKKMAIDTIINQPTAYDVDKVVEELKELRKKDVCDYLDCDVCLYSEKCSAETDQSNNIKWDKAIEIVKQGVISDDVCEWKFEETNGIAWHCDDKCTTYNQVYIKDLKITLEDFECKCPYCGKKIKVIGGGVNDD